MVYLVSKKHAQPSWKQSTVCPSCEQEFPSYYSLQQHRRKEHGTKQRKPGDTVADLNQIEEQEGEDGDKLKEELSAGQHFLVDTEMENGRYKVFNFQLSKLVTKITNEQLEEVFNKLNSAAKIKIALGFVFRNIETGKYQYFYAYENNTLFEKSDLLCNKAELIKIQGKLENFDIVDQFTQERQNTNWRFNLITKVGNFCYIPKRRTIQRSFLPFPRIGHVHEWSQ